MKKKIKCEQCEGKGEVEVTACDECGYCPAGQYEGKYLCQNCWAKTLTDTEINAL